MGLFGKQKEAFTEAGYAPATEPGAIPVATPVPMAQTAYLEESMNINSKQNAAIMAEPLQQQSAMLHHSNNNNSAFMTSANNPTMSRGPMMMRHCPHCGQESRTRVTTAPVWQTWAASGIMCFVFWPIFWVPLVVDSCKDTSHYCVLCGNEVGKVSAFEDCCVTNRG